MLNVDPRDVARHVSRLRRPIVSTRKAVVVRDVPGGWMTARPGEAPGEFPSTSVDRVYWLDPGGPIGAAEIGGALAAARELGRGRVFMWLAPWGWSPGADDLLRRAGAEPWPHVEYITLLRRAEAVDVVPPSGMEVRALTPEEAPAVLAGAQGWYGKDAMHCALRQIERGVSEIHMAFENGTPIALSILSVDGAWSYMGAAETDPARRNRGAQKALVRSRVRRSAELGAQWCICETNTALPISLANLHKCGFEDVINWLVYRWDESKD